MYGPLPIRPADRGLLRARHDINSLRSSFNHKSGPQIMGQLNATRHKMGDKCWARSSGSQVSSPRRREGTPETGPQRRFRPSRSGLRSRGMEPLVTSHFGSPCKLTPIHFNDPSIRTNQPRRQACYRRMTEIARQRHAVGE